jgi:hypothetical protein
VDGHAQLPVLSAPDPAQSASQIERDPRDNMEITPDWANDSIVYIDGRVSRNKARHMATMDGGWYSDTRATRCHMRLLTDDEAEEITHGEFTEFWWKCTESDPGALPMWRVEIK